MGCPAARADGTPGLEAAARSVAETHQRGDALAALASRAEPDPFLVAEVLCGRSPEAARAFAAAATGPDTRALDAYVRKRLAGPPAAQRVALLLAAQAEHARKDWKALAQRPAEEASDVTSVALELWRAEALRATGQKRRSADAYVGAAARAREIGWLRAARDGFLYGALGSHGVVDYRAALAAFQELRRIETARQRPWQAAEALFFQGAVRTEIGQYAEALERFAEAKRAFEQIGDDDQVARVLNGMTTAHRLMGEYSRSLVLVERGLELVRTDRNRMDLLESLGTVLTAIGSYDKAVEANERVLELARGFGRPAWIAQALGNTGYARSRVGDYEAAHAALTSALETAERIKHPPFVATALTNLGDLAMKRGRFEEALVLCRRARDVAQSIENPLLMASVEQNVAECLQGLGRLDDAVKTYERVVSQAEDLGAPAQMVLGHLGIAECRLAQGKAAAALAAARLGIARIGAMVRGLAEGQDAEARAQHARLFAVGAEAAAAVGDEGALADVLETGRAMALLESLEGREKLRRIAIPEAHREEERVAQAALAEARTVFRRVFAGRVLPEIKESRNKLDAAKKRLAEVIGRIRRSAKDRAALVYPTPDDLGTLEGHLEAGEALVLYARTTKGYLALVVEPGRTRIAALGTREEIDGACARLVEATAVDAADAETALSVLTRLVIAPLGLGAKCKRVFVSPTGNLFLVPLSALVPRCNVIYVPSGTTYGVLRSAGKQRGEGVVAFGDVDYSGDPRLRALPASGTEAKAVGDTVLLGAKATEDAVRTVLPSRKRWRAVHFACHGILDLDRPMHSALALTKAGRDDGRLRVVEIFSAEIPADLVALSACESGRGRVYRAEGLIGLTRAFMYAGAPRVLCSLWKVDDAATRALMTRFYEAWNPKTGEGVGAAAALKLAQEHVRAQPKWKHPYYWAAWVLWGLPD